ncbi:MAG: hypothetical protein IK017_04170 [Paludibacteraceae bacterium]|nr:hypothetical protein [Paludibacteraceae bacterium]MBR5971835.1 hypothetical protein [Paludibacteraceae bacterium]
MNNNDIESYLLSPVWLIDLLPKQVPANSKGQYFRIEKYYRETRAGNDILWRFIHLLLKINCYEDMDLFHESEGWTHNPAPELLEKWILGRDSLYVILPSWDVMIYVDDDLYMTLYCKNDQSLEFIGQLVTSEGLFLWKQS